MKKPLRKLGVLYFGTVVLFAALYWFKWSQDGDAFIVNSEFNVFPNGALRELLQATDVGKLATAESSGRLNPRVNIRNPVKELQVEASRLFAEREELERKLPEQQEK